MVEGIDGLLRMALIGNLLRLRVVIIVNSLKPLSL